mmetsp:Transcript_14732/g.29838  ORF Transcript_14732/g.29838 Transcript_14732/m.29838 type:complete len:376 (+) Transcript_14732:1-1128(+)
MGYSRTKIESLPKAFRRSVFPLFAVGGVVGGAFYCAAEGLLPEEKHTIQLFKDSCESVVAISNLTKVRVSIFRGGYSNHSAPQGTGSGFVWDNYGHIVTNHHVVQNASEVRVKLNNGEQVHVEIVGVDQPCDIAVLRVPDEKTRKFLRPLKKGDSEEVLVGQKVYAIGYPFGLDQTLTSGIVSGTGRSLPAKPRVFDIIQMDAAINPGSSGGPLLDSSGRLIGVNQAIITNSRAFSGVGYAIPVNIVKRVVDHLIKYGRVVRPGMGVTLAPDYVLSQLGTEGALVIDVIPGRGAYKAGVNPTFTEETRTGPRTRLGDVIVAINGRPIRKQTDVFQELAKHDCGDTVVARLAKIQRDGQRVDERNVKIRLEEFGRK